MYMCTCMYIIHHNDHIHMYMYDIPYSRFSFLRGSILRAMVKLPKLDIPKISLSN